MASTIRLKSLAALCRRAGTAHAAGVDARTIWGREAERGNGSQRRNLRRVSDAVAQGATLADALGEAESYFPRMFREMVDVGERTGRIDEVFNRLARHYDHQRTVRAAFLAGISWPVIQLCLALLIVGGVIGLMGLLPPDSGIDMLGFGLIGLRGVLIYFAILGVIGVAGFLLIRSLLRGRLSAALMTPLMGVPVVGRWLQLTAMSRMAWSLGMALEAGMDAKRSVDLALRSTQNRYFTQHAADLRRDITDGQQLHAAFAATGAFSEDFLDAVEVGEQSGRLTESLDVLSRQYEEQSQAATSALAVAMGVGVWMTVAAIIIFFIFRLAFFYLNLLQSFM